jgi:hypothetical protein
MKTIIAMEKRLKRASEYDKELSNNRMLFL